MTDSFTECEHLKGRLKSICRCEAGLPINGPNSVNSYRASWGLPLLSEPESHIGNKLTQVQKAVSLVKTIGNSIKSLVTTGKATVSQAVIDERFAICQACPEFTGTNCKLCDCSCSGKRTLMNKLANASAFCPADKPRWLAVPEPTRLIGQPIDRSKLQSHIIYHVMPLRGETEWVWRRHLTWLREVRSQFNGRFILGVVTASKKDAYQYFSPSEVERVVHGLDAEIITAPNDSREHRYGRVGLGEGVLWPKLLEQIQTTDTNQVAFYGHCKGVTRPGKITDVPHRWAVACFDTLFRNYDAAINALDSKGICGAFLMPGGYKAGDPGVGPKFFFSGTFFAMRLADVFTRNWRRLPQHYGCVEQMPRVMFDRDTETACLFFNGVKNLYDEAYWNETIQPELDKWYLTSGVKQSNDYSRS